MKKFIFVGFLFMYSFSFSQMNKINDSLINEICKTLISNQALGDSIRLNEIDAKHIFPILENIENPERQDAFDKIDFRLQRNCNEYKDILRRLIPGKGDWAKVDQKPNSKLNQKACLDFLKLKKYYYLESSGDTVHATIKNGFWEDHFIDGTYSKLKFYWINDCEFEIEFIESNNRSRKNLSRPGDKYKYQILEKENKHYKLSVEIVGTDQFMTFKLYY